MKKLFAVLMAIALVLSMGTTMAFAEGETTPVKTGSITINNAFDGAEYKIYQMLKFEPSSADAKKGVYTIVPGWENFFANNANFLVTNNNGKTTVTLKNNLEGDHETLQLIAKAAVAYAEANTIAATKSATATATAAGSIPYSFFKISASSLTSLTVKLTSCSAKAFKSAIFLKFIEIIFFYLILFYLSPSVFKTPWSIFPPDWSADTTFLAGD